MEVRDDTLVERKTNIVTPIRIGKVDADEGPPCLVVIYGPLLARRFTLDRVAQTIGRSDDAEIRLDDDSASRSHARVVVSGRRATLVDLESTNGTWVNEKSVREIDLRDLYAYLRSLKPSERRSQEHDLGFFYRWRFLVGIWKWLFFTPGPFAPDPAASPVLNRGRYLATALGHCGECHTPRNFLGASKKDRRFAGAKETFTIEAMMQNGWALQAGTSHDLGQTFAKAYGIQFQGREGALEHAWSTSWGVTTRLVGAVVMVHGDDAGIVIPPRLAQVQCVVLPIHGKTEEETADVKAGVARILADLKAALELGVGPRTAAVAEKILAAGAGLAAG